MLRFLQVTEDKQISILDAGEAMVRGGTITKDYSDGTVDKATAATNFYLADVAPNSNGINAIITPTDAGFEAIAAGDKVLVVPTYVGERYATTELTIGALVKGNYLKSAGGKFVAAEASDNSTWVYGGLYSDPTGLTMYVVEKVELRIGEQVSV